MQKIELTFTHEIKSIEKDELHDRYIKYSKKLLISSLDSPFDIKFDFTSLGVKYGIISLKYTPFESRALISSEEALGSGSLFGDSEKQLCRTLLLSPSANYNTLAKELKITITTLKNLFKQIKSIVGVSDNANLIKFLLFSHDELPYFPKLTNQENIILKYLADGMSIQEIITKVNTSKATIRTQIANIRQKLDSSSVNEALVKLAKDLPPQSKING
jgi:DNA-binding CsgD family transcriptional regulator